MAQTVGIIYQRDLLVGAELRPTTPVKPLVYSCENIRLGEMQLGSKKWHEKQPQILRRQHVPELVPIIGTPEHPIDPDFIDCRYLSGGRMIEFDGKWVSWKGAKLTKYDMQIAKLLRQCNHHRLSFLTVVTSIAYGWYEAWVQCQKDAERLKRNIRKLFPGAIYLLLPEVDLVQAGSVPDNLLPRFGPASTTIANQLAYKIHFHGVIYVPSMTPDQVEDRLMVTPNGRRSRFYSGANQVRAVPLYFEDDGKTSDVLGCIRYGNKRQFRPPNMERMAEGYAEWLLLNYHLDSDETRRVVGRPRDGILVQCCSCNTLCKPDGECECQPVELRPIDFYDEHHVERPDSEEADQRIILQESKENYSSDSRSSLNSSDASIWDHIRNQAKESFATCQTVLMRVASTLWAKITPKNGP